MIPELILDPGIVTRSPLSSYHSSLCATPRSISATSLEKGNDYLFNQKRKYQKSILLGMAHFQKQAKPVSILSYLQAKRSNMMRYYNYKKN